MHSPCGTKEKQVGVWFCPRKFFCHSRDFVSQRVTCERGVVWTVELSPSSEGEDRSPEMEIVKGNQVGTGFNILEDNQTRLSVVGVSWGQYND